MIILNESKELVRLESWEDIQERPGFTDNLDPADHELSAIIGQYAFSDRIRCGLSNCHTPHAKGYLVATKDGRITNIGKDCGKTYFGVDFETMAAQFDRDMRDKDARERLWNFSFGLDGLKDRIAQLREGPRGADSIYRALRPLVEQGKAVPTVVVRRINTMLKTGETTLTIDREATAIECEMEEARTGKPVKRPMIVSDRVADIQGMEALYESNNLRQLLVIDLGEQIHTFESLDIDSLTSKDLSSWAKWAGTTEQKIGAATQAVQSSLTLLTRENLAPFGRLIEDQGDQERYRGYLSSLP
jgi:hypothetical protein